MTTPAPMTPEQRAALMVLADRVEALTGLCRETDALIDCAVRFPDLRPADPGDFGGKFGYSPGNLKVTHGFLMAKFYTRSLDDAMTLVPEGWVFTVGHWVASDHLPAYFADCADIASVKAHDGYDAIQGRAATPALALVAAALRARAAS